MDDAAAPQGIEEKIIGGPGQCGETLLGPDEGRRTDSKVAVGMQEVRDFAIGHSQSMFEFGGHGQNARA